MPIVNPPTTSGMRSFFKEYEGSHFMSGINPTTQFKKLFREENGLQKCIKHFFANFLSGSLSGGVA